MKVAILENEIKRINGHLKSFNTVSYSDLNSLLNDFIQFDVIVLDKEFVNYEIVKLFKEHDIETVILNFGKIDFNDDFVTEIIDYSEIDDIKQKMRYVETKLKLKKHLKKEQRHWDTIRDLTKERAFAA